MMIRATFSVIVYTFLASLASAATTSGKSSDIPAKREFPLSTELNPCQDFYKYVCSKVDDSFELRPDRSRHDFAFNDASERLLDAKKAYFAGLSKQEPQGPREAGLKTFYLSCMDEGSGKRGEREWVKKVQGQIQAVKTRDDMLKLLAQNRMQAEVSSARLGTTSNQDKPLMMDVVPEVDWLTLPEKTYYDKPEVVSDLRDVATKFFATLGDKKAKKKAATVVDFELGLAKEYLTRNEFRDIFNTRTGITRAELLSQFPNLRFEEILTRVPDETHIRNVMPKAMAYVNAQLASLSLDNLKTLYLYNALYGVLDDAYPDFYNTKFAFEHKNFGGPETRPERAERCTREVMSRFLPELDSILWPRVFPGFDAEKVRAMAEKIRSSILASLEDNTWLSKTARQEAIRKIKTATLQLVAPQTDEEWNFRPIGKYDIKAHLQNQQQWARLMLEKELTELKGPISPKRWGMGPLTVNAYYNQSTDKFVLPVGILQYPFYDQTAPMELNLGGIGTVVGHELGHGIDDKGSLYDAEGKMNEWMTAADLKEFQNRTHILVDQFAQAGQNGPFTLGENIGDLVGVTAAHRAAFGSTEMKGSEELERAFFVAYGRMWCEVQRPKLIESRFKQDPHPVGVARVNEQIRQQPAFEKAFACKAGDPMVLPADKRVKLW